MPAGPVHMAARRQAIIDAAEKLIRERGSTDFTMAIELLQKMFSPAQGVLVMQPAFAGLALLFAAWWAMIGPNAFEMRHEYRWNGRMVLASGFAASLAIILGMRSSPFLYFQF